jgi:hypothetical protein
MTEQAYNDEVNGLAAGDEPENWEGFEDRPIELSEEKKKILDETLDFSLL